MMPVGSWPFKLRQTPSHFFILFSEQFAILNISLMLYYVGRI